MYEDDLPTIELVTPQDTAETSGCWPVTCDPCWPDTSCSPTDKCGPDKSPCSPECSPNCYPTPCGPKCVP